MADSRIMSRDAIEKLRLDKAIAEGMSRKEEARFFALRARRNRDPRGGEDYDEAMGEADQRLTDAANKLAEVNEQQEPIDLQGTPQTWADSSGNYAANAEVARAGGIGVYNSNSVGDTDQPAHTEEEAGFIPDWVGEVAISGRGGRSETPDGRQLRAREEDEENGNGEGGGQTDESVQVPDDWESMSFQERRALAQQISPQAKVRTGEQAGKIINKQLRKQQKGQQDQQGGESTS